MINDLTLFNYEYIDNHAKRTLFLLHGTGGNKHDLLFFDDLLTQKYNLVGLEGNILENGMPRFFKRHVTGVFDQESLKIETQKLHLFIRSWCIEYAIEPSSCSFLGYSNGANMLLATLLFYPSYFKLVLLLHPMMPFPENKSEPNLSGRACFVSIGTSDTVISPTQGALVSDFLRKRGAEVTFKAYPSGHEVIEKELSDCCEFLEYNTPSVGR